MLAICAVGDDGVRAFYSERGANLWVCTPSQGRGGHAITTTDRTGTLGFNAGVAPDYANANYTNTFNGTSSAAPLAAGVIALVLEANPNLTWRDLRIVLAQSARKNHAADADWVVNGGGFNINHNYGFRVADANWQRRRQRSMPPSPTTMPRGFPTPLRWRAAASEKSSSSRSTSTAAIPMWGTWRSS